MRVFHRLLIGSVCALASTGASAANAQYQAFLFQACPNATGALAALCASTIDGLGNVSTDSESSLNPSQNLSHNRAPLDHAQQRTAEARDRSEGTREETSTVPTGAVQVGPFSLLVNGRGSQFERERSVTGDSERGTEGDTWGVELGFEKRMSDQVTLGAILAYEKTSYDFDAELPGVNFVPAELAGDADGDTVSLTGYVSFNPSEHSFFEASAGYGRLSQTLQRNSIFQVSTRAIPQTLGRSSGDADGSLVWASANAGYDWASGATTFGPYIGATYSRSQLDAYTERDLNASGLNMRFDEARQTSLIAHAGLRFDRAFSLSSAVIVPQLRVEYLHEMDNDAPTAQARFVLDSQGTVYDFAGDEPDEGAVSVGLGLTAILRSGWIWFLNVDHLASGDLDRQRVTLGVRVEL